MSGTVFWSRLPSRWFSLSIERATQSAAFTRKSERVREQLAARGAMRHARLLVA